MELLLSIVLTLQVKPEHAEKIRAAVPAEARAKPKKERTVLAWTRATGFVHGSIPHGALAVEEMGKKTGAWKTEVSNDLSHFLPEKLKRFDAVVMCNTTGDWIKPKKEEALDEAVLKKSLLEWVEAGGGLAGFHSASDANYKWPEFGTLVGGWFHQHPWHEAVAVKLDEKDHPLLKAFDGKDFTITDEIYQFKDPYSRKNVRVLLSLDVTKTDMKKGGIQRKDEDFAVAWVRTQGKGKVFYSSLGHREEIYWNPTILKFTLDGIQFALGDLEAPGEPKP